MSTNSSNGQARTKPSAKNSTVPSPRAGMEHLSPNFRRIAEMLIDNLNRNALKGDEEQEREREQRPGRSTVIPPGNPQSERTTEE